MTMFGSAILIKCGIVLLKLILTVDTDCQTLVKCPSAERDQVVRSRVEARRSSRERKQTQFYGMNYIKEGENAVF